MIRRIVRKIVFSWIPPLESYCDNMKSTAEDNKVKDTLSESELKLITDAYENAIEWLENHELATKEEYEQKLKEVEEVFTPIVEKIIHYPGDGC